MVALQHLEQGADVAHDAVGIEIEVAEADWPGELRLQPIQEKRAEEEHEEQKQRHRVHDPEQLAAQQGAESDARDRPHARPRSAQRAVPFAVVQEVDGAH
jgi:hypothetical protein